MSWLTALKLIPWVDVIEATPAIVKGAKRLLKRSQDEAQEVTAGTKAAQPQTLEQALVRVGRLEAEMQDLAQQQADSAALLESLAEQNARLVAAVEVLRARSRLLVAVGGLLALGVLGLLAALLQR